MCIENFTALTRRGPFLCARKHKLGSQNAIRDSEKLPNTLDVFEYLLLRFIAFGHVRR